MPRDVGSPGRTIYMQVAVKHSWYGLGGDNTTRA